jgi:hypothetical protein
VIDMIANAKRAFDVFGHARTGPEIGSESGSMCALEQMPLQPLTLPRGEFKRPPACRDRFQCRPPADFQIMLPTTHAARIDIEAACDLGLSNPLFQESDGMLTFTLQLFWTALRSDRSPPHNKNSIGHYLCRNQ